LKTILVAHELNCNDCKNARECIKMCTNCNGGHWEADFEGAKKYEVSDGEYVNAFLAIA